jgi:hypothetical protein
MLVIPLSQHLTATMIIVVLRHQTVNLYEKASLVFFHGNIVHIVHIVHILEFSNDYSYSLLNDLAKRIVC